MDMGLWRQENQYCGKSQLYLHNCGNLYRFAHRCELSGQQSTHSDRLYRCECSTQVLDSTPAPVSTPTPIPTLPSVSFTGTPTSGTAPLTVQFLAKTIGTPLSREGDFDDGGTITSTKTDCITVNGGPSSSRASSHRLQQWL